jgi:hypothetical protein
MRCAIKDKYVSRRTFLGGRGVDFTAVRVVLSLKAMMLDLEWTIGVSTKDLWIMLKRLLS